jgi:hypothetical protein
VLTVNDPETCPVDPETPHMRFTNPVLGVIVVVHVVAVELNPVPLRLTTVPLVPVGGDTWICAMTVKFAQAPMGTSFPGVPFTVTFHRMLAVADDPTMKLPVAT